MFEKEFKVYGMNMIYKSQPVDNSNYEDYEYNLMLRQRNQGSLQLKNNINN